MCILDIDKNHRRWHEDPNLSLNDNLFFAAVHYVGVFFGKYKINRHNNEHDFDDMAADCSIAVYESAKRNYEKRDTRYGLECYMYGRAWSTVGQWLKTYFAKKQRTPLDVPKIADNRLSSVEYDVGIDEIGSNNFEQGLKYVVFKEAPLSYLEKRLTDDELEYVRMVDDCVYYGLPIPTLEDFDLEDSEHKSAIKKILGENYVG